MRTRRLALLVLVVTLVQGGCASTRAPYGWLPPPSEKPRDGYGGWITAEYGDRRMVEGELIAVGGDSVAYVLASGGLAVVRLDSLATAEVWDYQSQSGALSLWTLGGTLSTLSHGVALVLSAPVWIIAGSTITGGLSREPRHVFGEPGRHDRWNALHVYARFPQGLPPGLDPVSLEGKTIRSW